MSSTLAPQNSKKALKRLIKEERARPKRTKSPNPDIDIEFMDRVQLKAELRRIRSILRNIKRI